MDEDKRRKNEEEPKKTKLSSSLKADWFPKVKNSLGETIPVMFGQTLQG